MTFELKEDFNTLYKMTYICVVMNNFKCVLSYITDDARIKKNGIFYLQDQTKIARAIFTAYYLLDKYFIIDKEKATDERDTLMRSVKTLHADSYKVLAELLLKPYTCISEGA